MTYESTVMVESRLQPGVQYTVARVSFGGRAELLRRVRELARKLEFLEAGRDPGQKMDAVLLRIEIDRLYVNWGLRAITGLELDGMAATPQSLAAAGPEELFREVVDLVRAQIGLSPRERKN